MPRPLLIELDLPRDWKRFRLPPALHDRLQELLDRQDRDGNLRRRERRDADGPRNNCRLTMNRPSQSTGLFPHRSTQRAESSPEVRDGKCAAGQI
jgi:hypothetical protein